MWLAVLDGRVLAGFDHRPSVSVKSDHVHVEDRRMRFGVLVPKEASWEELRIERMTKGGFK